MRFNKREGVLFILIGIIAVMGVGYAYLTTDLNIVGSSLFKGGRWDVYWDNVRVSSGSVTADSGPTIDVNKTKVTYTVTLNEPGDFFEFTVDAVNGGTIDAMIDIFVTNVNGEYGTFALPNYLDLEITYDDGIDIEEKHFLASGDTEKYKLLLQYRDDINPEDLPSEDETITIEFYVEYKQAIEGEYIPVRYFVYTDSDEEVITYDPLDNISSYYESDEDVTKNIFLRHNVFENTVAKSDIGFVYDGTVHYLTGIPESDDYSETYKKNKRIMKRIFGANNCYEEEYPSYTAYYCNCTDNDGNIIDISMENKGSLAVINYKDMWCCASDIRYHMSSCFELGGISY